MMADLRRTTRIAVLQGLAIGEPIPPMLDGWNIYGIFTNIYGIFTNIYGLFTKHLWYIYQHLPIWVIARVNVGKYARGMAWMNKVGTIRDRILRCAPCFSETDLVCQNQFFLFEWWLSQQNSSVAGKQHLEV